MQHAGWLLSLWLAWRLVVVLLVVGSSATPIASLRAAAAAAPIRVGVFECVAPSPTACFVPRVDVLHGMWFDAVNARGGLLGRPVQQVVAHISASSVANETEMEQAAQHLLQQPVDFVIWPVGNHFWPRGMALLEAQRVPAIAAGSVYSSLYRCDQRNRGEVGCLQATSFRRRFEFVHSPSNVDEYYLREWVGLLRVKRATTLAVLRVVNVFYDAIEESLGQMAADYRLALVYSALVPSQGVNVDASTALVFTAALQTVAADGVVLLVIDCSPWLDAMRALDYMPPALISLNCIDNAAARPLLERNFVAGAVQWDARLEGSDFREQATDAWAHYAPTSSSSSSSSSNHPRIGSPALFAQDWRRHYNSSGTPGYTYAFTLGGLEMLEAAVVLANTTDGARVNEQLRTLAQPSFYGMLQTNAFGFNQFKPVIILQQDQEGTTQIVAPVQYATADFVYPAPAWRDRVYRKHLFALPVERAFLALSLGCTVCTTILLVCVILRWQHPNFRASRPSTYAIATVGCLAGYASVLTWSVENTTAQCVWRVWLVSGAFHAVVQPMLAAAFKVQRIHSAARVLTPTASERRLRLIRVAAVVPVVVLNAVWTWAAPLHPETVVVDALRPAGNFTVCAHSSWLGQLLLILSCLYGGALLLLTSLYAYRIRQLPRTYHDAQALALSVYLFGFSAFCLVVIQSVLGDGRERPVAQLAFALRSGGVLIVYQTIAALLVGSRIPCRRRKARPRYRASVGTPLPLAALHPAAALGPGSTPAGHGQEPGVHFVAASQRAASPPAADRIIATQPAVAAAAPSPVVLHAPHSFVLVHNPPAASVVDPAASPSGPPLSEPVDGAWSDASLELDPPVTRV